MSGNHQEMERVLENIDQLASMLKKKLEETEDHKPLDEILKKLTKYVSTNRIFRRTISNHAIYRSLEKEDEEIKAMQKRALVVRVANNNVDAGKLVSSCQAIKNALDTFYVSCSCFSNYSFIDFSPGWAHSFGGKEHAQYPEGASSRL